jgi:molecular chaperone DnaK (HSP70)
VPTRKTESFVSNEGLTQMLLGIDYGTTRTVVAVADRGNYPVVSFQSENDDPEEWYPSLIAFTRQGAERAYGFEARAREYDASWSVIHSFKRQLATLGPESPVALGGAELTTLQVLTEFLTQLRRDLFERSNLRLSPHDDLEALISVPANANSNQRYVTLEAFRLAGFQVRGTLNEPSAAGVEYAHRYRQQTSRLAGREFVAVYDLGGGTFDASVISMMNQQHEVLASDGIGWLGGDDFDRILLDMALAESGIAEPTPAARLSLLDECREKKEGLHPNTRKLAIDLGRALPGMGEVIISTADFYDACRPLVERTIVALEQAVGAAPGIDWPSVATVYMVGGSSELPIVTRTLRERYGRQLRRSPYPHATTAIGSAIAANADAGYQISEHFTRHFGVWREADGGTSVTLDVIFAKETALPAAGKKLQSVRRYYPAHNLGHFRFVECGSVDAEGQPTSDITVWEEIHFPFTAELEKETLLSGISVQRTDLSSELIEEIYSCDEHGIIQVQIINHATRHQRTAMLHRVGAEQADTYSVGASPAG